MILRDPIFGPGREIVGWVVFNERGTILDFWWYDEEF